MSGTRTHMQRGSRGFILVAALWIVATLAALAAVFGLYVVDTNKTMGVHNERVAAEAAVIAALELTAFQVGGPRETRPPAGGGFGLRLGGADVAVEYLPENARIDLNAAPAELIAGLFVALGANPDTARGYADRIVGWRTPPVAGTTGREDEIFVYRSAGLPYLPRGALFPHVAEIWRVAGLPEQLVARAIPFLTVYSGTAKFNILYAAPTVVAAAPGMTPDRLQAVLAQRTLQPELDRDLSALLGPAASHVTTEPPRATRVRVRVSFASGYRTVTEAVILVTNDDAVPYRILSWHDAMDERAGGGPTGIRSR